MYIYIYNNNHHTQVCKYENMLNYKYWDLQMYKYTHVQMF